MPATILIAGQGLAGTMLAWEFEREGIDYVVADGGHERAASRSGAGIINPITGQRIVKSWKVDEFLPAALAAYGAMEAELGETFLRKMRIRRLFADDAERRIFAVKQASGELAPYVGEADDEGFWIKGGAQVDTGALIAAMRTWLGKRGRLITEDAVLAQVRQRHDLTLLCTGAAPVGGTGMAGGADEFEFARLVRAKGEMLTLAVEGLEPGTILNRGHWVLPLGAGLAKIGATFEPGVGDLVPTAAARGELERSARDLLGRPFAVVGHHVGIRTTTPDRHPVIGRSPGDSHVGIFNGLGSKGALLAPRLARQWVNHLTEGVPFDATVDVARFRR